MRILIVGYGKMGKEIEKIALDRGHLIIGKITSSNKEELNTYNSDNTDAAIEFTDPESAFKNISYCIKNGIPVLSGSTGWLEHLEQLEIIRQANDARFFYASNYSIGVNLFFKLNKQLARLMSGHPYTVGIEEIHHTEKKDAPSGTAITLAEGLIANHPKYTDWNLDEGLPFSHDALPIRAIRKDPTPGTHTISYESNVDKIEITHTAHSRQGFALGAVLVAEWLVKQASGHYRMDDFMTELK